MDSTGPTNSYGDGINLPPSPTDPNYQQYWPYITRTKENLYQIPMMGNLTVEYYGTACTNPSLHPADPAG